MNAADEQVDRVAEEILRRVALLEDAVAQHRDPLAERHRLDLVVRDVDGRHAEPLVQQRELRAHAHPQLGVEVGQRLVHEERLRLADDGPAHGHALALPAGQRGRAAVEQVLESEDVGHVVHPPVAFVPVGAPHPQAERHVPPHGHARVEGVALEHHRDVALLRQLVGHVLVADVDAAAGHLLQPGDHPQQRRLAAPRRADEHHELTRLDREVHVADRVDAAAEALAHVLEPDAGRRALGRGLHDAVLTHLRHPFYPLSAPAIRPRMKNRPSRM